jgi:hypothetical protein
MENESFSKCVECDNYWLLNQQCLITDQPRKPSDPQCGESWATCSESPEEIRQKLYDLLWNLEDCVGGKYYSLAPICGARKGICLKGKNGLCTSIKEGKLADCEFKFRLEHPDAPFTQ